MVAPRGKWVNRQQRLQAAKAWVSSYRGRDLAHWYGKWFGVDWASAFTELDLLGYPQDPVRIQRVLESVRQLSAQRQKRRTECRAAGSTGDAFPAETDGIEWDDTFTFIAGFTSGGCPYGVTREEDGTG